MNRYQPELGQTVFSNTPWMEIEMQAMVESGIALLGALVTPLVDPQPNGEHLDPCGNVGGEYRTEAFSVRSYCWCDGTIPGHESGCPPNFQTDGFAACWYKYLGRGGSQNRLLTTGEWNAIMRRCLESLAGGTEETLADH